MAWRYVPEKKVDRGIELPRCDQGDRKSGFFYKNEDAERATAALNACEGIPTEQLETLKFKDLVWVLKSEEPRTAYD